MSVTTRFAPSPTGYLHIGGARTALYYWLHAKREGGQFVLRIEDTDRERSTEDAVQAILDAMAWLNLAHDGEIYYQTQRFDRYAEVIGQLLGEGRAYKCYSSADEVEAMRDAARAKGDAKLAAQQQAVQEVLLACDQFRDEEAPRLGYTVRDVGNVSTFSRGRAGARAK